MTQMKRRLRLLFLAATLAAFGIILSQFYWVYYNYSVSKTNFINTANYALQKSIDAYQLGHNKLPTSLDYKDPSLTVFMRTIPSQDSLAFDTPSVKRRFSAEFMTVAVDTNSLEQIRGLIARLVSQEKHSEINADTLTIFFHEALLKNGITDKFRITISPNPKHPPSKEEIAELVYFHRSPVLIRAELLKPNQFILRHNLLSALISCLLILLCAGSLFYMWRIIRSQMRLDSMKTDFINNVTHELRTPITILKASTEAMISFGAGEDPESLRRYLETNSTVLDGMNDNVERILDFSKWENKAPAPNIEPVDLPRLVFGIVGRFAPAATTPIKYRIGVEEVMTDANMLETILSNLLDNGLKYGGPEIQIDAASLKNGWYMTISDNGGNIPPQSLPYIFDKFYRAQTGDLHEVKGYGLGLAQVRQLVTGLGGSITVKSVTGKDTVFTITFTSHE